MQPRDRARPLPHRQPPIALIRLPLQRRLFFALLRRGGAATAILCLAFAALPANAQIIGGYPLPDPALGDITGIRDKPPTEHLLDADLGGLKAKGIKLVGEYLGEAADIASGGNRRGTAYAGQLEITADLDLGTLAGLNGTSFHVAVVNRHGRSASTEFLGDRLLAVQEIYGGAGRPGTVAHLAYAYGEIPLHGGAVDIEAGRLPVTHDFASSPLYCDLLSTIVCGSPRAEAGDAAFTIFPNSTWGARLRLSLTKSLVLMGGAYQVRSAFGGNSGFDWGFSSSTGVVLPVEVDWLPKFGTQALPGHYKVGVTYDSSDYTDLALDAAGLPFARTGAAPRVGGRRSSYYVLADQMIVRTGAGATAGVVLFGGVVQMNDRAYTLGRIAFGGAHLGGLAKSRPDDAVNLLFGYQRVSAALTATQRIDAAAALPLAGGAPSVQTSQWVAEANYNIHVTSGLHLIPDMQYVTRPDATAHNRSALVLACRISIIL